MSERTILHTEGTKLCTARRLIDHRPGLSSKVAVLPEDRVYSLEVQLRSEAEAGIGPHERLGKWVAAAPRLLAEAHGEDNR